MDEQVQKALGDQMKALEDQKKALEAQKKMLEDQRKMWEAGQTQLLTKLAEPKPRDKWDKLPAITGIVTSVVAFIGTVILGLVGLVLANSNQARDRDQKEYLAQLDARQREESAHLARLDLAAKLLPSLGTTDSKIQKQAYVMMYYSTKDVDLFHKVIMADKGPAALEAVVALLGDRNLKEEDRKRLEQARNDILSFQVRGSAFVRIVEKREGMVVRQLTGIRGSKQDIVTVQAGAKDSEQLEFSVYRSESGITEMSPMVAKYKGELKGADLLLLRVDTPLEGDPPRLEKILPQERDEVSIPGFSPRGTNFSYVTRVLQAGPAKAIVKDVITGSGVTAEIEPETKVFTFRIPLNLNLGGAPVFDSNGRIIGIVAGRIPRRPEYWYAIGADSISALLSK
jgi:hypothetical protein